MISSPSNPKLKAIRRLRRSKGPQALLEGPNLLSDALDCGLALTTVLATAGFLERSALTPRLMRSPLALIEVSEEVIASLSDADSSQGVIAVANLPRLGASILPCGPGDRLYLYLDRLQDPGNLGAIARVAEAAGASALALSPGCVHPNHPRALRASAGSLLRLPVAIEVGAEEVASALGAITPRWIALVPRDGIDLYSTELPDRLILALGAEGSGLSSEVLHQAILGITIPVRAPVESLNVAVAAAVVIFELVRRQSSTF